MSRTTAAATATAIETNGSSSTASASKNSPAVLPAVLTAAPPPWHSLLILFSMVTLFLWHLPTLESIDRAANVTTFTTVLFPSLLSLRQVAFIRLGMAACIWALSLQTMLGPGWAQETTYRQHSKLVTTPNQLKGIKTMFPFTSVAWNLLGAALTLSGMIALEAARQLETNKELELMKDVVISPWLLRSALILWEMAAPFTLLVATVIRYAIWPAVITAKASTANLKTFRNIMMHNCNVLFAMVEICFLGGISVRLADIAFCPLVGCAYVVFSWLMAHSWNAKEHGPQYIYFFFDTTLGKAASIALVLLLVVLMAFYVMFVSVDYVLEWMNGSILAHASFVALICSLAMRFDD